MVITLKGDPKKVIPSNSEYCIEAYGATAREGVTRIAEGHCTKSVSIDLDPGSYVAVIRRTAPGNPKVMDYYWYEQFFVGVNEEQFQRLKGVHPTMAKMIQTSEGARWTCKLPSCSETLTTAWAMVAHEAKHNGFDLEKPKDMDRFLGIMPTPEVETVPKVNRT